MQILCKLSDLLERILKISLIMSMGAIALFVNLSVTFRYVLSAPLSWTNELCRYLLVYTVLFGAGVALRKGIFVKIEALLDLIPQSVRKPIILISQLLMMGFLVICITSPTMLIEKAVITQSKSPALGIPMFYLYRLLQVGFSAMLFFLTVTILETLFPSTLSQPGEKGEG